MRRSLPLLALVALLVPAACRPSDAPIVLHGSGATLPHPLYARWSVAYGERAKGVRVDYQAVGSGAGVRQVEDGVVDFGATDEPMSEEQVRRMGRDVVHVPMTLGAVAIAYNLEDGDGARPLRLTGELLADVFRGQVTRWDDARIKAENPGRALPGAAIVVVHRADGSGTSATLTTYLSRVSEGFRSDVGPGPSPRFPVGVGARGNEGVAAFLRTTPRSLGYLELAHARAAHLAHAEIKNRRGAYVAPAVDSVARAAASIVSGEARPSIVDATAEGAYPIAALSYVVVPRQAKDRERGEALARFLWWGLHEGQALAPPLSYATLPPPLVLHGERALRELSASADGRPLLDPEL